MDRVDRYRRVILNSRPEGAVCAKNLKVEEADLPDVPEGHMLLKTKYLSLDPYQRGRMSDAKSYAEPLPIGATIGGGTISEVVESKLDNYRVGDWVLCYSGWQEYGLSDGTVFGSKARNLGQSPENPSWYLGVLGMPGFTGYAGLMYIGKPKPGETVVVAAATGPVGSTVGQVAKIKGCRAVGIAGGPDKCRYAVDVLGFDACIDRHASDFAEQLEKAVPEGIDIYFESVGGKVLDAVWPLLNDFARVPLCGTVSQNDGPAENVDFNQLPGFLRSILVKKITIEGFIIDDSFGDRHNEFVRDITQWVHEGKIQYLEHQFDGIEAAPEAFVGMLNGHNFGKTVIKMS